MNNTHKTLILITLVAVSLGCGYSKPSMTPTPGTTPTISQLNPASTTAGSADFVLEVDGTNFATNAVISFAGNQMVTTPTAAGKLQATIPASAVATARAVPVTVTNPGTGGIYGTPAVTSAAMQFMIN